MPYNPYGDSRADYRWSIARKYLPDDAVLIGEEFWDLIGGKGTYRALLSIYEEVGEGMRQEILEAIAG